jgi:hypothetical protein
MDPAIAVTHRLPLRARRDIAHADALVQHQLADVRLDTLGNVARQALDLNLAPHELEQAALLLDAFGFALEHDRNRHAQRTVHRHAVEVCVQELMRDRIELIVLDQDTGIARAIELQRDQRVRARLGMQNAQQGLRLDGDRGPRPASVLLRPTVQDRRNVAAPARAPRLVLPRCVTRCHFQNCFHGSSNLAQLRFQLSAFSSQLSA